MEATNEDYEKLLKEIKNEKERALNSEIFLLKKMDNLTKIIEGEISLHIKNGDKDLIIERYHMSKKRQDNLFAWITY